MILETWPAQDVWHRSSREHLFHLLMWKDHMEVIAAWWNNDTACSHTCHMPAHKPMGYIPSANQEDVKCIISVCRSTKVQNWLSNICHVYLWLNFIAAYIRVSLVGTWNATHSLKRLLMLCVLMNMSIRLTICLAVCFGMLHSDSNSCSYMTAACN